MPGTRPGMTEKGNDASRSKTPSNRQVVAHGRFVHVGTAAGQHDLAALHDEVGRSEVAGEFEILLDEEDRHVAALGEALDDAGDLLDDRGLDALGRLVE